MDVARAIRNAALSGNADALEYILLSEPIGRLDVDLAWKMVKYNRYECVKVAVKCHAMPVITWDKEWSVTLRRQPVYELLVEHRRLAGKYTPCGFFIPKLG